MYLNIFKIIFSFFRARCEIRMTRFLLRLGLLLAGVALIAGRNLFEEIEFDEIPDDVELINIGSDLSMLGIKILSL